MRDFAKALVGNRALLIGMALLTLGAGLQATLLGVRATLEGLSTFATGAVLASYYAGFVIGSMAAPALVRRVGHIRVFAALTATAAATILVQGIYFGPWAWAVLRAVSGVCFAGIYVVAESWLNDRAGQGSRGVLLASYMVVGYLGTIVPILAVGWLADHLGLSRAVAYFSYAMAALSAGLALLAARTHELPPFAMPSADAVQLQPQHRA